MSPLVVIFPDARDPRPDAFFAEQVKHLAKKVEVRRMHWSVYDPKTSTYR